MSRSNLGIGATVLWENHSASGGELHITSDAESEGYNLFGSLSGAPFPLAGTDTVGADPMLGELGEHGGPTPRFPCFLVAPRSTPSRLKPASPILAHGPSAQISGGRSGPRAKAATSAPTSCSSGAEGHRPTLLFRLPVARMAEELTPCAPVSYVRQLRPTEGCMKKPTKLKDLGAAWVIYETYGQELTDHLVGLVNPRRGPQRVTDYLQQLHVDRFWDIEDKVAFKKAPTVGPKVFMNAIRTVLAVQSDVKITLTAVRAERIRHEGHEIEVVYPVAIGEPPNLGVEKRRHRISLKPRRH